MILTSLDPESVVDREQQRSIASAGLCCALRPGPFLHATPPSWPRRRARLPGRAQPWQQPHGTDAHGQPLRRSCHGRRNQRLRSQRRSRPQVFQHSYAAHEGQGTQRSHLLGHMMPRAWFHPAPLQPSALEQPSASVGRERGRLLLLFLFLLRALMIIQVKPTRERLWR